MQGIWWKHKECVRIQLRRTVLVLCVFSLMCLSGCGYRFDAGLQKAATVPGDDLIVVGMTQVGSESVWRTANTRSVQEELTKQNGYYLSFDNARQKQENQIKSIRNFISQQVDYIILSPIREDGWETVLQEAKNADVPVILMDRKVKVKDESLYTTWIGSDFTEEGRKAGVWLEEYLRGNKFDHQEINVVMLQGTTGSTAMLGRTEGFMEVASRHPEWNLLEQVDADFTTAKGEEEMTRLLNTYDQIDVLISQNDDMTFGALDAIEKAGKTAGTGGNIIVISFDAVKKALENVKAGTINVDIECNPLLGKDIRQIIEKLEAGQSVEKAYYIDEKIFTQKNVLSVLNDRQY